MQKTITLFGLIFLLPLSVLATKGNFGEAEKQLQTLLSQMRTVQGDGERNALNDEFKTLLRTTLHQKGAFNYPFDSLGNYMSTMKAPDGKFRLFNWNLANNDRTYSYFCYVMYYDKREKEYRIEELKDNPKTVDKIEDKVLFQTHWFGALYHDIIPQKKGGRTYYTVLGWKGKDRFSTVRVIDVIYFQGRQLKMGAPLFLVQNKLKKRVVMEHRADTQISIKFHSKNERIVFDHLSSGNNITSASITQGADNSYDSYEWKKNKWVFVGDVTVNGERTKHDRDYVDPQGDPFGRHR